MGSPRRSGNTESLVDAIIEGASLAGAASEKIRLCELVIGPCKACNGCRRTGECVQKDDMSGLVQLMKESDVWILGTPVYWWGPTSQFKAFVDRWYGLDQRVFQGKRVVAAIPMGGGNEHYARHIVGMLEDICSYLRMDLIHTLIAPGMNGKSSVKENSRITELARQVGQEIMRPSAN